MSSGVSSAILGNILMRRADAPSFLLISVWNAEMMAALRTGAKNRGSVREKKASKERI